MRSIVVVLLIALAPGCTKPRHAWVTMGVGAGIAVTGAAIGLQIDKDKSAPDEGFGIAVVSTGVGGGLVVIGLVTLLVLLVKDKLPADHSPPSGTREVGWKSAAAFGERARAAASAGDCKLAIELAGNARDADAEYYERVLLPDPTLARCY
jgi:hypothetical protein